MDEIPLLKQKRKLTKPRTIWLTEEIDKKLCDLQSRGKDIPAWIRLLIESNLPQDEKSAS